MEEGPARLNRREWVLAFYEQCLPIIRITVAYCLNMLCLKYSKCYCWPIVAQKPKPHNIFIKGRIITTRRVQVPVQVQGQGLPLLHQISGQRQIRWQLLVLNRDRQWREPRGEEEEMGQLRHANMPEADGQFRWVWQDVLHCESDISVQGISESVTLYFETVLPIPNALSYS